MISFFEYRRSMRIAVAISFTLRSKLRARPISFGNRLRASCCVSVEPPCVSPVAVWTSAESVRHTSTPRCSKKR
jgi:hypothetical protein